MSGNTPDLSAIHALITDKKPPDKANLSTPLIEFDLEKYLAAFECEDMTQEEAEAVLTALWEIMCRFVELGFGIDAGSLACGENGNSDRLSDADLLCLNQPQETD